MSGLLRQARLVGRLAETGALDEALRTAAEANPVAVIIAGDAGIGKSRLAAEVCGRAAAAGWQLLSAGCIDLAEGSVPYLALVDALRSLTAEELPPVLEHWRRGEIEQAATQSPFFGAPDYVLLPITGADGEPLPGSIAELTSIDVNGRELGLMIRGHDTHNPVLLFLAGGPGGSELGAMRNHLPVLEEHFTVATLDQRGTGTSYPALDPSDTYTLESAIADTVATTNYLRARFAVDRVVLVGQSWGTILGVLTVRQEPTLYSALVGVGQMVSPVETDRIFYTDTLAWAREHGKSGLATSSRRSADRRTPPCLTTRPRCPSSRRSTPTTTPATAKEPVASRRTSSSRSTPSWTRCTCWPASWTPSEPSTRESRTSTCARTPPRSRSRFSSCRAPTKPRVAPDPSTVVRGLAAPTKETVVLDRSGHRPLFEQPDEFVDFMTTHVQPVTR